MSDKSEKSFNQELLDALERCSSNLSFDDISRLNGIRIELLRRYIDRRAKNIRSEIWDKLYPLLRPYLEGPAPIKEPPPRLGAPYRRHPDLVEMLSEQKVLLDEFAIFDEKPAGRSSKISLPRWIPRRSRPGSSAFPRWKMN